jgi:hypothetical protein
MTLWRLRGTIAMGRHEQTIAVRDTARTSGGNAVWTSPAPKGRGQRGADGRVRGFRKTGRSPSILQYAVVPVLGNVAGYWPEGPPCFCEQFGEKAAIVRRCYNSSSGICHTFWPRPDQCEAGLLCTPSRSEAKGMLARYRKAEGWSGDLKQKVESFIDEEKSVIKAAYDAGREAMAKEKAKFETP